MVPKKPLLRLDLRLVNQVVADAQECPSDEFLFEEFPRSHQVVFRVQQVVVPWAMCPAGGSALDNVSMKVTFRLSLILRVSGLKMR